MKNEQIKKSICTDLHYRTLKRNMHLNIPVLICDSTLDFSEFVLCKLFENVNYKGTFLGALKDRLVE